MKENRGRFQAQGRKLEESEKWATDEPISLTEGLVLVEMLKKKLSKRDLQVRAEAFSKCIKFVKQANENGGLSCVVIKAFPKSSTERVDLEIRYGIAFVNLK